MKRTLFLGILFMGCLAVRGQGYVHFNTYSGTVYSPIRYVAPAPPGAAIGQTVGSEFKADLYYALGSNVAFTEMSLVPGSTTSVGTQIAGYVSGGVVTIPDYAGGPVTFAIVAYNGADYASTYAALDFNLPWAATLTGNVATWTEPAISTSIDTAGTFSVNLPPITVSTIAYSSVPEPTATAMAIFLAVFGGIRAAVRRIHLPQIA